MKTCNKCFMISGIFVLIISMITCEKFISANKNSEMESINVIITTDKSQIEVYDKQLYINGIKNEEIYSVIEYNEKLYISSEVLNKTIGESFTTLVDGNFYIRRCKIQGSSLLECDDIIFIELNEALSYLHVNNDVFKRSGELYIDSALPSNVNVKGRRYDLIDNTISKIEKRDPDLILYDGRGVFYLNDGLAIEDDLGNLHKYVEDDLSTN